MYMNIHRAAIAKTTAIMRVVIFSLTLFTAYKDKESQILYHLNTGRSPLTYMALRFHKPWHRTYLTQTYIHHQVMATVLQHAANIKLNQISENLSWFVSQEDAQK